MTTLRQRKLFLKELTKFLVDKQSEKSVMLQLGRPLAKEWAELRSTTPLFGYPNLKEAEQVLGEFLGIEQ